MPHVVVTRPQPDAALWVQQLQSTGLDACALPMLVIAPNHTPAAQAALEAALGQLTHYHALMFVSGNAVRFFSRALQRHGLSLPAQARLWTPGPGTTQALLALGTPVERIDQPAADAPQFDSEALWTQVQHQVHPGQRVLIVRGGDGAALGSGRAWLTEQLQRHGAQVDFAPVYVRQPPPITPQLLDEIAALRSQQAVWLFSSSECVQHLRHCQPSWSWRTHTALATHPRIAHHAQQAGFGRTLETPPTLHAITASIKSLHDHL